MKPFVAVLLLAVLPQLNLQAASRDAQWKRVEDAVEKGLPQTALQELAPIVQGALADRAWAEAVKAIAQRITLEGMVEGNQPEERIRRLEAEIARVPPEIKPVLDAILAHWYWQYFRENRWRFMQRTATAQAPGQDFETWDLPRLFAEIDRQFTTALSAAKQLQSIPVATYDALLTKGALPDRYRPTLYDFIAQEALTFYTAGEQAGALPQDAFEVLATSPVLGTAREFLDWAPVSGFTGTTPPAVKAIQLYADLLRFHAPDADQTAFLDVDLERLVWAKNVAIGEEKSARFLAALKRFAEAQGDHELAAMALAQGARAVHEEGDFVQAWQLASRATQIHPRSPGGQLAANLIAEIEAKSAGVTAERIWNRPWPTIAVRYRNVDQVHFRLIAANWDDHLNRNRSRPENLRDDERTEILARPPAYTWSHSLPPTTNYRARRLEVAVPGDFKPGFYFLIASHTPDFADRANQLSMTDVWVSDLALVLRHEAGALDGFVLEAESGEPVPGAQVQAWYLDRQGQRVPVPALTTDAHGAFKLTLGEQRSYVVKATAKGQSVAAAEQYWAWGRETPRRPLEQTILFTDRALYRPGQTIQYKGICLRADQAKDTYETLAGRSLTVVFVDVNRKEIARQQHRANDYGSFSGSFTAPRDRLLGRMHLRAADGPAGIVWINVEEYKRPKFQVTLDAPKAGAKLGDTLQIVGHAMAYTGAAVDDAQVKYRVVREVRMPWWWGWYGWRRGGIGMGVSQEIAHGTLRTGADGAFTLDFVAKPDAQVPVEDDPTFVFQVHADVTDSAGETRSNERAVHLGYIALEARLSSDPWLTDEHPVELRVRTTTLEGEPQTAEGSVRVHALQAPERVSRPSLFAREAEGEPAGEGGAANLADPNHWELGPVVSEQGFTTDAQGEAVLKVKLTAGAYRAVLETQDRYGKKVTGRLPLSVVRPADKRFAIKVPNFLEAATWTVEPGSEFTGLWGTGYAQGRAFVELECQGKPLQQYWTQAGETQTAITQPISEAMRGGITLRVTQVRENRAYLHTRRIEVPWSNKDFTLRWEHFTSKLQPGQKETWSLLIKPKVPPPSASASAGAELVATLYDRSLDAFLPLRWTDRFAVFRQEPPGRPWSFGNAARELQTFRHDWSVPLAAVDLTYRAFPPELTASGWGRPMPPMAMDAMMVRRGAVPARRGLVTNAAIESLAMADAAPAAAAPKPELKMMTRYGLKAGEAEGAMVADADPPDEGSPAPDLNLVSARRNLNETAFFYPHLVAEASGAVRLGFTMPEALTEWRFLGFAHDRALRSGFIEAKAVTAKDLMVQPNPPRFLREGDVVEFTVKVTNPSDQPQRGRVRLTLNEAFSDESADARLGNRDPERPFELAPQASTSVAWRLRVPDGLSLLTYKAVAASATVSDGEEGLIPVLARRILVTESLPLPMAGPGTQRFEFEALRKSGRSRTLRHQGLTVQMVSNPAWYAVLALPYLMEFPYECNEQVFNRFYANALARFIANADPKIRRVFDQWKATPALDSPLEKHQDLKTVMLEESPWVCQAQKESEARRNVGVLFDDNRLNSEIANALNRVREAQLEDGSWPWFPGGRGNDYITLYIVTGFGRLRHLGADLDVTPAVRALARLDAWLDETYRDIRKRQVTTGAIQLTPQVALYLYGRSFFRRDQPVAPQHQEALDYFLDQAKRYALSLTARQSQGHLALALNRFGDTETAQAILKSLREKSVTDPELGRYWRDTESSWWWYDAPVETQALMIEAFEEVAQDSAAVEGCQVWLIKQKQTQDWRTTKATADAVYALLRRGRNLLAADQLVEVELGGLSLTPPAAGAPAGSRSGGKPQPQTASATTAPEAGTGFYERRFTGSEVKPSFGRITVRKQDAGIAWGSVHWQYLEDLAKVSPHERTPLTLNKTLFTKRNTLNGPVLEAVRGPLAVGDELVVRLELRTDRDMEFVHLKDQRGSGAEPMNVLSGYRYQDALAYYESTRDTASHFFIDHLRKGTYVFEYSTRVQLRGEYESGVASVQCLYAPEFNSHSESTKLTVN